MRIISSAEVAAVSGGDGWVDAAIGAIEDLLGIGGGSSGSSSGSSCQPYSNNNGSTSVTQTCGAGGVSTVVTTSPGVVITQTVTPATGVSASGSYGPGSVSGSYNGAPTVTTVTCINGSCSAPVVSR
ncbi:hypothetical protein [Massilia sp. Root335]|uniref:hypothetical protein n=1 Tax=Massilia sp. Root335 TaxID=1736517 RepID=UPI000A89D249|nr:hypothetical protein [Massilia sp. Root335]